MFCGCSSLLSLPDISKFNTRNVINMKEYFMAVLHYYLYLICQNGIQLMLQIWNRYIKVEYKSSYKYEIYFFRMFIIIIFTRYMKLNTNNARDMKGIFSWCSSLLTLPDISKWNINKVIDIAEMFNGCSLLLFLPDI